MKFKKEILLVLISSSIATIASLVLGEVYVFFKNKSNWATIGAKHDRELGWVLTSNNSFKNKWDSLKHKLYGLSFSRNRFKSKAYSYSW